jgi:hypothetical protein
MEAPIAKSDRGLRNAVQFWEPRRMWYNAILLAVVMLWLALTWPHFRPALNWADFGKMCLFAFLANVCYCAAYVAEFLMKGAAPVRHWTRIRYALWTAGMLLALLVANYWIADEIYPDVAAGASAMAVTVDDTGAGSNMNFPAPLAVVGFLGACGGVFAALAASLIFWFARKPGFARVAIVSLGIGAVIYFGLLVGFSEASHDMALRQGQEKYFCEIDCHLAYSVVDVKRVGSGDLDQYAVTLRTRFDEKTISPQRRTDVPLMPSPREVRVIDSLGHAYEPVSTAGASLMTPLRPAESYTTDFEFRVPNSASGLRLLINTVPAWPDRLVIGDENSWLHKKTYFGL